MNNEEVTMIHVGKTRRGFTICNFSDYYDVPCSLQKSSIATTDCIWLGVDDPDPKIMASQERSFGVSTNKETGWVPYPIPSEVVMDTRMHLSREQVAELLPILQKFVDTGEI